MALGAGSEHEWYPLLASRSLNNDNFDEKSRGCGSAVSAQGLARVINDIRSIGRSKEELSDIGKPIPESLGGARKRRPGANSLQARSGSVGNTSDPVRTFCRRMRTAALNYYMLRREFAFDQGVALEP